MRMHLSIILCAACVFVFGFFSSSPLSGDLEPDTSMDYETKTNNKASINWTTKVITVKGYGMGPGKERDLGRRKLMARRAAEIDAYRKLLEVVKGVRVTSYVDVKRMMSLSPSVAAKVRGMIKGMQVTDINYGNDGGCTVTITVNIDKEGNFLLAALKTGEIPITDNYPKFDWIKVLAELGETKVKLEETETKLDEKEAELVETQSELDNTKKDLSEKEDLLSKYKSATPKPRDTKPPSKIKKEYTGLLVDARGVNLKPALAPSILNQKKEKMYGIGVIPAESTKGAIVSYMHGTIERAKKQEEIGNNPLVVKCLKVLNNTDIMINDEDAQKVVWLSEILEQKRVAVLI